MAYLSSRVVAALLVLSSLQVASSSRTNYNAKIEKEFQKDTADGFTPSRYVSGVPVYHPSSPARTTASLVEEGNAAEKTEYIIWFKEMVTDEDMDEFCHEEAECECMDSGHPGSGGLEMVEVDCTEEGLKVFLEKIDAKAPGVVEFVEGNSAVGISPNKASSEIEMEEDEDMQDSSDARAPRFGVQTWHLKMAPGASVDDICSGHVDECAERGPALVELRATAKELEEIVASNPEAVESHGPQDMSLLEDTSNESVSRVPWGLCRIQSQSAVTRNCRDTLPTSGGAGVHVYVLDTGIRTSHRDFKGRAFAALQVTNRGRLQECPSGSTTCARDRQGHGTHCAGTVGGSQYGVAKGVSLYAVKVLGDDGSGTSAGVLAAMDWVATNAKKPAVASMSLGGGKSRAENNAVKRLTQNGITVVVAAGNENTDACTKSPASAEAAITVGSTQQSGDRRSSFSNWGRCLNIYAPGSDVNSASHHSDTGSTEMSGTSMACPHVSGAAALLLAENGDMTPDEVKSQLVANGIQGQVRDPKSGSPNVILHTASSSGQPNSGQPSVTPTPAPRPKPTPRPPPSNECSGGGVPYTMGNCKCRGTCYQKTARGWQVRCPFMSFRGRGMSTKYYEPDYCNGNCMCK